jgi:hypothetical protein
MESQVKHIRQAGFIQTLHIKTDTVLNLLFHNCDIALPLYTTHGPYIPPITTPTIKHTMQSVIYTLLLTMAMLVIQGNTVIFQEHYTFQINKISTCFGTYTNEDTKEILCHFSMPTKYEPKPPTLQLEITSSSQNIIA